jgi:hypothetical protein
MIFLLACVSLAFVPHQDLERVIRGPLGTDGSGRELRFEIRQVRSVDDLPTSLSVAQGARVLRTTRWPDYYLHLMDDVQPEVARRGGAWFVFYDVHPGAGNTWYTSVARVDRKTLSATLVGIGDVLEGCFEHGDGSRFASTGVFFEYRYWKYQGRFDMLQRGFSFLRVAWKWDAGTHKFVRGNSKWVADVPRSMKRRGSDPSR